MKLLAWFFIVLVVSIDPLAQPQSTPDLSKLTVEQLHACYRDSTYCGTRDEQAISNELGSRIRQFSTNGLLACFADWRICGSDEFSIADELRRRGHLAALTDRYWSEPDDTIRTGIILALYRSKLPQTSEFMSRAFRDLRDRKAVEEQIYWPADYLARNCDQEALNWLASRKARVAGCMFYSETIAQFGKCEFRPAIPYLVTNSLDDACLNIDDAAIRDLRKFYPGGPKEFGDLVGARKYYCERARRDGFEVNCP